MAQVRQPSPQVDTSDRIGIPQIPESVKEDGGEYPPSAWGRTRCAAVARTTGKRCKAWTLHGSRYCEKHAPRNAFISKDVLVKSGEVIVMHDNSPQRYKTVIVNEKLREKYLRLRKDKSNMEQEEDLALIRAMLELIVEKAFPEGDIKLEGIGPTVQMIKEVTQLITEIEDRQRKTQMMIGMRQIESMLDKFVDIIKRLVVDQALVGQIVRELSSVAVESVKPMEETPGQRLLTCGDQR